MGGSQSWVIQVLPWFMLGNIVWSIVIWLALRAFAVGKWSEGRERSEYGLGERVDKVEHSIVGLKTVQHEQAITLNQVLTEQARHDERIKHCEHKRKAGE